MRFIGAFVKLRKATVRFVTSVCLSVRPSVCLSLRMEQLSSHWTDFHKCLYLSIFRKSIEEIKCLLKCDKITGTLHEDPCTFVIISRWNLFKVRNVSDKFVQKNKTHTLYSKISPLKSCHLWDNVEIHGRDGQAADDNIMRCMRFACWITKAAGTHLEYVILFAFSTITLVMRTRLDITYMHKMPIFYVHEYRVK